MGGLRLEAGLRAGFDVEAGRSNLPLHACGLREQAGHGTAMIQRANVTGFARRNDPRSRPGGPVHD